MTIRLAGAIVVASKLCGCALNANVGVLQRGLGTGAGGSLDGHAGIGLVTREIVALEVNTRLDIAAGGSRLAFGTSILGGVPIGRFRVLARAGLWGAPVSSTEERTVTPSFELAGYVPLRVQPEDKRYRSGPATYGVTFGVREDFDRERYTTLFVGLALFMVPGP